MRIRLRRALIAAALTLSAVSASSAQSRPLPETSVYRLRGTFTDQDGRALELSSLRGSPVLMAMFYGSCRTMCPIIIEDARAVDSALSASEREQLRVVLVTIDPERDTPEALRALAADRSLPVPRWSLLRAPDSVLRPLAMVLGVQYRRLPNGDFAHSASLTLLDREGRIAAQIEGLRRPNLPIVDRLHEMLASHAD